MDGPLEAGTYECKHCLRTYDSTWIKRHLVAKHGYKWWDNWNVYQPDFSDDIEGIEPVRTALPPEKSEAKVKYGGTK